MPSAGTRGCSPLFEVARGRRHAELLTPAIEFICRQADVTLDEIGAIAVDVGPGLFTGVRVGIATAKAMAHALRVPVIPIASVDLLAFPLRHADRLIAAVVDARRERGLLRLRPDRQVPGGVQRLIGPVVGSVDDLIGELLATGEEALLRRRRRPAAPGRDRDRSASDRVRRAVARPSERGAARAAGPREGAAGGLGDRLRCRSRMYLRKPDAEIDNLGRPGASCAGRLGDPPPSGRA